MNVRDFECRSYEQAVELLGDKDRLTVGNNTMLSRDSVDFSVNVVLHGQDIVWFHRDGRVVLDSCGYRTEPTKERINRCLPTPWQLCQSKGVWALWRWDLEQEVPFVDGMTVPGTGPSVNPHNEAQDTGTNLCSECRVEEHDQCPMTPGCSCCANTALEGE
ncbi:hypothetical protein LCGC14_0220400 [marine sediment metagenome]|uniref:Uncharacterized protein n=1 Tax=marine sediment metagenome TaxID=412755 RepID=A0A0F9UHN6_9ZZZZ